MGWMWDSLTSKPETDADRALKEEIKHDAVYGKWNMNAFPKDGDPPPVASSSVSTNNSKSDEWGCFVILFIAACIIMAGVLAILF